MTGTQHNMGARLAGADHRVESVSMRFLWPVDRFFLGLQSARGC